MMFADDLSDASLDATLDAMANSSSPFSLIQFRGMGGAMARVGKYDTAFAHRERNYFLAIIGIWLDASEDIACMRVDGNALAVVRHERSGVYVNFLEEEGDGRIAGGLPTGHVRAPAEVKAHYDPNNLFRFNQNIPPQG